MKIKNLILTFTLVTLTATSFGQRSSIRERLFNRHNDQVEFITAEYNNETGRIENWMQGLHSWVSKKTSRSAYITPVVSESIFLEQLDFVYEEPLGVESWMVTPFDCGVAEEDLEIESWMTTPFKSSVAEDLLFLESWMTIPFEVAEDIELEDWMTKAWFQDTP